MSRREEKLLLKIGLTGGIASGKSLVSQYLRELGAPVFDADEASRKAVSLHSPGLAEVLGAFGSEYALADGNLDRAKMAAQVFGNAASRRRLENIIHKQVWQQAEAFGQRTQKNGEPLAFFDVPLLIECGWHRRMDKVWLVSLPVQEQIRRAVMRDKASSQQIQARIAAQLSLDAKKPYADLVIDNSGSISDTKKQVAEAWENLRKGLLPH